MKATPTECEDDRAEGKVFFHGADESAWNWGPDPVEGTRRAGAAWAAFTRRRKKAKRCRPNWTMRPSRINPHERYGMRQLGFRTHLQHTSAVVVGIPSLVEGAAPGPKGIVHEDAHLAVVAAIVAPQSERAREIPGDIRPG